MAVGEMRASVRSRPTPSRRELLRAGAVSLAVSALYVSSAWIHGALGAARNDDWAYYRIAFRFAKDGVFELNGWPAMMLVGHTIMAWPIIKLFGDEIAAIQVFVALTAALGLFASYLVVRSFLTPGWSALAIGCLALGPIYGTLAVSYMTDVPAFTLQALTLLAALRALRSDPPSTPWFVAALGLGLAAFSVREYAVAAGLAVSLVGVGRSLATDPSQARRLVWWVAGWLTCVGILYLWRSGLPDSFSYETDLTSSNLGGAVRSMWHAGAVVALFVAPALVVASPLKLLRAIRDEVTIVRFALVCLGFVVATVSSPVMFPGNYFTREGASYTVTTLGAPPVAFGSGVWDVLRVCGFASMLGIALVCLLAVTRNNRERRALDARWRTTGDWDGRSLVIMYCVATASIAFVATMVTGAAFFDRYLIALVPFGAALLIRASEDLKIVARRGGVAATTALVALMVLGVVHVDATATLDGGKWKLATAVTPRGFDPADIDGGFEWYGFHQPGGIDRRPAIEGRAFWIALFEERPICATIALSEGGPVEIPGAEVPPDEIASLTPRSLLGIEYRLVAVTGPNSCDRESGQPET